MRRDLHERNRRSWNHATAAHQSHKLGQAAFFRDGGSTLFPEEMRLLGDVAGRRVVHLQCNAGQDTLSIARLGADVVGVDISDVAVAAARQLAEESGIAARFEQADVLDWLPATAAAGQRFDVTFSSYGALCWLSDLGVWARGVAGVLAPGGRAVAIEFHPTAMMFDENGERLYPYSSGGEPIPCETGVGDYVAASGEGLSPSGFHEGVVAFQNPEPSFDFAWGVADVITALLSAGLTLATFEEYPHANGCRLYRDMEELPGRRFGPRGPAMPMMYGVVAVLR